MKYYEMVEGGGRLLKLSFWQQLLVSDRGMTTDWFQVLPLAGAGVGTSRRYHLRHPGGGRRHSVKHPSGNMLNIFVCMV